MTTLSNDDYRFMYGQIKPYIKERIINKKGKRTTKIPFFSATKPTTAQKARVSEYHRQLFGGKETPKGEYQPGLITQPVQLFKSKSKAKMKTARKYANQPENLKWLRGVYIPVDDESTKAKITIDGDNVLVEQGNVESRSLLFTDYEEEEGESTYDLPSVLERIMNESKPMAQAEGKQRRFRIMCGRRLSKRSFTGGLAVDKAIEWQEKYKDADEWLLGLEEYKFTNQIDWDELRQRRAAERLAKSKHISDLKRKANRRLKGKD